MVLIECLTADLRASEEVKSAMGWIFKQMQAGL
jgi:hypothetical protein